MAQLFNSNFKLHKIDDKMKTKKNLLFVYCLGSALQDAKREKQAEKTGASNSTEHRRFKLKFVQFPKRNRIYFKFYFVSLCHLDNLTKKKSRNQSKRNALYCL